MSSKELRKSRRAYKVAEDDAYEEEEGILYAPGIDHYRKYNFSFENSFQNSIFLVSLGPYIFTTQPLAFKFSQSNLHTYSSRRNCREIC